MQIIRRVWYSYILYIFSGTQFRVNQLHTYSSLCRLLDGYGIVIYIIYI